MRIALFEPDIPQNTGNIFRLSACLGISLDIIEPTGFIFDDKRFKRALMDYIKFINYKRHLDWKEFYEWSQENNFRLIGIRDFLVEDNMVYISMITKDEKGFSIH